MLAFATVVAKFIAFHSFSDPTFYLTINKVYIGSLKFLHTLFDKQLDHVLVKFEQSLMVRNLQNFEIFGKYDTTLKDVALI